MGSILTKFGFCRHIFVKNSPVIKFDPLNAKLNPICYLLALLGTHYILHVSRIRVKGNPSSGNRACWRRDRHDAANTRLSLLRKGAYKRVYFAVRQTVEMQGTVKLDTTSRSFSVMSSYITILNKIGQKLWTVYTETQMRSRAIFYAEIISVNNVWVTHSMY